MNKFVARHKLIIGKQTNFSQTERWKSMLEALKEWEGKCYHHEIHWILALTQNKVATLTVHRNIKITAAYDKNFTRMTVISIRISHWKQYKCGCQTSQSKILLRNVAQIRHWLFSTRKMRPSKYDNCKTPVWFSNGGEMWLKQITNFGSPHIINYRIIDIIVLS